MIDECGGFKWRYAIITTDPYLNETIASEELCSTPYGSLTVSEDVLIAKTYAGPHLFEMLYILKGKGVRVVSVLDMASSLVGRLSVGTFIPVYASTMFPPQRESLDVPSVPDFELLIESLKELDRRGIQYNKIIALSTYLPIADLYNRVEEFRALEIDVIDRVSAYVYNICKGKIRCITFDIIDSNIPKGILRETVHNKSSKYYEILTQSIKESVEILKSLGEVIQ